MKMPSCKTFLQFSIIVIIALAAIQFIPYGHNHLNPPVAVEPVWNSDATRSLVKRACFNCHSNETVWPWYSRVAPISWMVQSDVEEGRGKLNFSEWRNGARKGENPAKIRDEVSEGEMPPLFYRLAHPEARLTDSEKRQLADGMAATIGPNLARP